MNNTLHIIQHSGLGDHILCNGIIRTYAEQNEKLFVNVVPSTADNVRYMYRDLNNIEFYELHYPNYLSYINSNPENEYLVIGCTGEYFNLIDIKHYRSFDHGFYSIAKVPYIDRWNKFYFKRDLQKEKEAYYDKIGLIKGEEYVFIHEDPSRGRLLRPDLLPLNYRIISAHDYKNVGVFDFIYTIEKAKEVHVMDSCFLALIDNLQLKHEKLFIHNYGRNRVVYPTPVKMKWHLFIDRNTPQNEMYYNNDNLPAI